jgi:hypothetical protein
MVNCRILFHLQHDELGLGLFEPQLFMAAKLEVEYMKCNGGNNNNFCMQAIKACLHGAG